MTEHPPHHPLERPLRTLLRPLSEDKVESIRIRHTPNRADSDTSSRKLEPRTHKKNLTIDAALANQVRADVDVAAPSDARKTVVILRGAPGSGKSHFAELLACVFRRRAKQEDSADSLDAQVADDASIARASVVSIVSHDQTFQRLALEKRARKMASVRATIFAPSKQTSLQSSVAIKESSSSNKDKGKGKGKGKGKVNIRSVRIGCEFSKLHIPRAISECFVSFIDALDADSCSPTSSSSSPLVIVDNCNAERWEYQPYVSAARRANARVFIVEFFCDTRVQLNECVARRSPSSVKMQLNRAVRVWRTLRENADPDSTFIDAFADPDVLHRHAERIADETETDETSASSKSSAFRPVAVRRGYTIRGSPTAVSPTLNDRFALKQSKNGEPTLTSDAPTFNDVETLSLASTDALVVPSAPNTSITPMASPDSNSSLPAHAFQFHLSASETVPSPASDTSVVSTVPGVCSPGATTPESEHVLCERILSENSASEQTLRRLLPVALPDMLKNDDSLCIGQDMLLSVLDPITTPNRTRSPDGKRRATSLEILRNLPSMFINDASTLIWSKSNPALSRDDFVRHQPSLTSVPV